MFHVGNNGIWPNLLVKDLAPDSLARGARQTEVHNHHTQAFLRGAAKHDVARLQITMADAAAMRLYDSGIDVAGKAEIVGVNDQVLHTLSQHPTTRT